MRGKLLLHSFLVAALAFYASSSIKRVLRGQAPKQSLTSFSIQSNYHVMPIGVMHYAEGDADSLDLVTLLLIIPQDSLPCTVMWVKPLYRSNLTLYCSIDSLWPVHWTCIGLLCQAFQGTVHVLVWWPLEISQNFKEYESTGASAYDSISHIPAWGMRPVLS